MNYKKWDWNGIIGLPTFKGEIIMKKIEVLTEKQWLDILDQIYSATLNGVPKVSKPVTEFADEYLNKYKDRNLQVRNWLIIKF